MGHALIIDDNAAIRRAMQHYLEPLGFESFDHTWTRQQALAAAYRRKPDLIVIGDDVFECDAFDAAKRISSESSAPVLMVRGQSNRTSELVHDATSCEGPFRLDQIERAVDVAMSREPSVH